MKNSAEAAQILRLGVEKIAVNSEFLRSQKFASDLVAKHGGQSIVAAVDVADVGGSYRVIDPRGGVPVADKGLDDYLSELEELGVGEILLQNIDRDGTQEGYDIDLYKHATDRLGIPVVALGGARSAQDIADVILKGGVSGAAAGSLFVFAGARRAVLINMPEPTEIRRLLNGQTGVQTESPRGKPKIPKPTEADESNVGKHVELERIATQPNRAMCTITVIDDSDPNFSVDSAGVCSVAKIGIERLKNGKLSGDEGRVALEKIAERARKESEGMEYDCLIGLSGGVDSSYVAMVVKQLGLNPLAIHLDNGWNTDTAIRNVASIVQRLNIDLETYVINWEDVKDLQRSFFKASVPDVEVITDHAIVAVMHREAAKRNIKTLIFGINVVSESIMPAGWTYSKRDAAHIRKVHRMFGSNKLTNFPFIEPWQFFYYKYWCGIHYETILSYIDFDKDRALDELKEQLNYVPYERKHGESRFEVPPN